MIKVKKIIAVFLVVVFVLGGTATTALGQEGIRISVDNELLTFDDAFPYIDENSRTMVPLYRIAEPLDLGVQWDGKSRTAVFSKTYKSEKFLFYASDGDAAADYYISSQSVTFAIGSKKAVIRYELCHFGEEEPTYICTKDVVMDTTAIIRNSRTYAPVRYLAEAFMCSVRWEGSTKTAQIATVVPIALKQEKGIITGVDDITSIPGNYSDPQNAITAAGYNVPEAQAAYAREVIDLVNVERSSRGIPLLRMDVAMMKAAQARAVESTILFSHTRPGGLSCFSIFADYGITMNKGSENLAYGYETPEEAVAAWMDSAGHRTNMLNPDYSITGVGCTINQEGLYYWSELFASE